MRVRAFYRRVRKDRFAERKDLPLFDELFRDHTDVERGLFNGHIEDAGGAGVLDAVGRQPGTFNNEFFDLLIRCGLCVACRVFCSVRRDTQNHRLK